MKPKVVPQRLEKHGHVRVDDYYWMRDREDPDVLAYLQAENARTRETLSHTDALAERLFQEIVSRIVPDDWTVPYRVGAFWYNVRYEPGGEYPIFCRRSAASDGPEQVMLDGNRMAEGHEYFDAVVAPSYSGPTLAYATDTVGRRVYTIRFRDLVSGRDHDDVISDAVGNMVWANDDRTLFYARQHPETLRSHRIYRHQLGTDPADDVLVWEEKDETFRCWVTRTKSRRYLLVCSSQTCTDEVRLLDADDPRGELRVFQTRERGHEYSVDHDGDRFYVLSNRDSPNFRLLEAPEDRTGRESWSEVVPHRPDVLLADFELFRDWLVLREREAGLPRLRVRSFRGAGEHTVEFDEPAYAVWIGPNRELDTANLRFQYTSLTTPSSVYDYDMRTRERVLLKRDEVPGGFAPEHYVTERLFATAPDGERIPISLVCRRDAVRDAPGPLLLYGYGSYGLSMDARFSAPRLSLIDRGFAYAIAHVRGGQELGRRWYDDGKLLAKQNTFSDFIACAEHLISAGLTSSERLFAMGGSAGGLLMGAVINQSPDLFCGVVANVPFVDVLTTMLDASIPLTTSEYDEWGDPNRQEFYDYILSYSPYDNVQAQAYPHLLVTTGLHDPQVQYWEPAKWVARLRARKTDDRRLLLWTNLGAGHGGPSGRFAQHRDTALGWAFLLDLAGIRDGD